MFVKVSHQGYLKLYLVYQNSLSKESFDKLNKVLNNLDGTLLQTQNLIDNLNQSPSDILFKQKNIKNGPGE